MTPKTLAALVAAALAIAYPVAASAQAAQGSSTQSASAKNSNSGNAKQSSQLAHADRKMIEDLVEANAAEIQTGQLALQKAQSPAAKEFAQKMVDDHTKVLKQVRDLAQAKGMEVKSDTDLMHKAMGKALGSLSGDRFDAQYMKRVGVDDHERTLKLLQKAQRDAKDPDLKSLAASMLPAVQQHLQMAQQNVAQMGKQTTAKR